MTMASTAEGLSSSKSNLARGSTSNLLRQRGSNTALAPGLGATGDGAPAAAPGATPSGLAPNLEKAAEAGQRIFENTYRTAPARKFPTEQAHKITSDLLEQRLAKVTYAPDKIGELSKQIAGEIVQSMKGLGLDRYKFVADVTIGEFKGQGIRSASRALWDSATDSFTSATFKNVCSLWRRDIHMR